MQGRLIIGLLLAAAVPTAGYAADAPRKPPCAKPDNGAQNRKANGAKRGKIIECHDSKQLPALVDPTPFFLL